MGTEFWESMCSWIPFYRVVFYLSVAVIFLSAVSFWFLEAGTATYYVTVFTLAINVPVAFGSGYLIRKCAVRRACGAE